MRGPFPGRDGDREIPGSDQRDNPQRLATGHQEVLRKIMRERVPSDRVAGATEESENIHSPLHFAVASASVLRFLSDPLAFGEAPLQDSSNCDALLRMRPRATGVVAT